MAELEGLGVAAAIAADVRGEPAPPGFDGHDAIAGPAGAFALRSRPVRNAAK